MKFIIIFSLFLGQTFQWQKDHRLLDKDNSRINLYENLHYALQNEATGLYFGSHGGYEDYRTYYKPDNKMSYWNSSFWNVFNTDPNDVTCNRQKVGYEMRLKKISDSKAIVREY